MTEQRISLGMQRARGAARVGLQATAGGWGIQTLYQQGSAKAILPQVTGGGAEVVFLNTAGGLTGGDRLAFDLTLGAGLAATATTQTAERAYRAGQGAARLDLHLTVGADGWLDWLPQETILFDGAALERRTVIRLDPAAKGCLALETVVLGRAAMGEVVRRVHFRDWREVWQGERLVFADPVSLDDAALGPDPAGLGGARAFASLVLVDPAAGDALDPVRLLIDEEGVRAAASALPGRLVVRALAADLWLLRRMLARLLTHMRRAPLPRVWQM